MSSGEEVLLVLKYETGFILQTLQTDGHIVR